MEPDDKVRGLALAEAAVRKLRVGHVVHSLTAGDGITEVVRAITSHIDRERFGLAICCLAGRGDLADEFEALGVHVFPFRAKSSTSPLAMPRNMVAIYRLARLLRRERFDILHTHTFFSGTLGRVAGWLAGVPVIIWALHNTEYWKGKPHIFIDRCLVRVTDRIIANSGAVREFAIEHEGLPRDRFVVVHNGIEMAKFEGTGAGQELKHELGFGPGQPVVGTVGRLAVQKGFGYLIEAAALVKAQHGEVKFVIVGGKAHPREDIEEQLRRQVRGLGLEGTVFFTGFRRDMPEVLASLDLFVQPSLWEGFGLAVAEAMAAGRAVVATRVGGLAELVRDGVTGILVPPKDPESLADAIVKLLFEPELREEMGMAGRRRIECDFTAEAMVRKLESVYLSAFGAKWDKESVGSDVPPEVARH